MTGYTGGKDVYIPNAESFRNAGKLNAGQKVFLTHAFLQDLVNTKKVSSITIERTDDAADRVVAVGYNNIGQFNAGFGAGGNTDLGASSNQTLKSLDLAGLDVSQVTNMSGLFANDKALESVVGLDTWKFNSGMQSVGHMFAFDPNLKTIQGIDKWDTSNFKYIDNLVIGDTGLTSLDLSGWKTDNVVLANQMFEGATNLQTVGDLSSWRLNNATTLQGMFDGASSIINLGNLNNWGTSHVANMGQLFRNAHSLTDVGNLSNWHTSNVQSMAGMFQGTSLSNIGDLSGWDTSKVGTEPQTTTSGPDSYKGGFDYMFYDTPNLTSIGNIHSWDVSNVTQMYNMFDGSGIDSINISGWHFNSEMASQDRGGYGTTDMFANLKNPTTITANNLVNTPSTFTAEDFAGKKALIVISNDPTLQKMNTQSDGSEGGTGHPADTIHYVQLKDGQAVVSQGQQQNFVYETQDALNTQLKSLETKANFKAVTGSTYTTLPDGDIALPEGTTDLEKISGKYDVGDTVHRVYRVIEDYPDGNGGTTPKTILTFDGNFYRPLVKDGDSYKYGQFRETTNGTVNIKGTGWDHPYSDTDVTAGQTTYDLAPEGYTIHFPNGADVQKINNLQWARMDGPIWFKNWYKRDHSSAPQNDNHLTVDIFQGDEAFDKMPESQDKPGTLDFHITYTANPQSITYNFVDDDDNGAAVKSVTVNGTTDETVDPSQTVKVPANYELVAGQTIPTSYKFKASGNDPVTIHLKHQHADVTKDKKKDAVTSTFHIIEKRPNGQGNKTIWTLTTTQYKPATKDLVTGKITYGDDYTDVSGNGQDPHNQYEMIGQDWVGGLNGNQLDITAGNGTYDDDIDGYKANLGDVPDGSTPIHITYNTTTHRYYIDIYWGSQPVSTFPASRDFYITYDAQPSHKDYRFVDDQEQVIKPDGTTNPDRDATSATVTGKTGENIQTPSLPAGWVTKNGQPVPGGQFQPADKATPITVPVKHGQKTVTPGQVTENNPIKGDGTKVPGDGKPTNDITYNDLHKTITRTINVTTPDGQTQTIKQDATLTRSATIDDVDGSVKYGNWSTGSWNEWNAPKIKGYHAYTPFLQGVDIHDGDQDETHDVQYYGNSVHLVVNYKDANGNSVTTYDAGEGHVGETTNLDYNAKKPAGWKLADGQDATATITPSVDDGPSEVNNTKTIDVTIAHATTSVDHNHPVQSGDKTVAGVEIKGAHDTDLNQTITRTINVTTPDGNTKTTKQAAHIYCDATVDEVTGEVTYTPWGTGSWDEWNAPTVAGYHADTPYLQGVTIHDGDQDETHNVKYFGNSVHFVINYQDDKGNTISTDDSAYGHVGEATNLDYETHKPAGWKLADGQDATATITPMIAEGQSQVANTKTINVKVVHNTKTVEPTDLPQPGDKMAANPNKKPGDGTPKTDITYNDLHKTLTRTITVHDPHNGDQVTTQTINYERTATIDDVDGTVKYGDWSVATDSPAQNFKAVDAPDVTGYTKKVNGDLTAITPTQDQINNWTDPKAEVTYTANDQTGKISHVDANGKEIGHTDLTGQTDADITVTPDVPAGWVMSAGQQIPTTVKAGADGIPTVTVKVEHGQKTVTPDQVTENNPIKGDGTKVPGDGKPTNDITYNDLHKTITRTINVKTLDGKITTTKQTVTLTRNATIDDVTGDVKYGDWSTDNFPEFDVPAVPGYTASQTEVAGEPVTADTQDEPVNITYTANDQSGKISYVDGNGQEIASTPLTGKTGTPIAVKPQVPAGWKIVDPDDVPATVIPTADGVPTIKIQVEHATSPVKPSDLVKPGDKIPGDHKKPGDGKPNKDITYNDLHKTITRTITIHDPHNGDRVITQKINYERKATIDDFDGSILFGNWMVAAGSPAQSLAAVDFPDIPGYTKHIIKPAQQVDPTQDQINNWNDPQPQVIYTANDQSGKISYVDANGQEIASTPLAGKTDASVAVTPEVPAGWKLVDPTKVPTSTKATADGIPTVKVQIEHDAKTVEPTDLPKPGDKKVANPNKKPGDGTAKQDITYNDLHKTISRTISVTTPDGKTTTTKQTVTLTRNATIDDVTGEVTYGDWSTDSFPEFDVPAVPGYTASQTKVAGETVTAATKNEPVNITYTANNQSGKISYVDANGQKIASTPLTGKTGTPVAVKPQVPAGWKLVDPDKVPAEVTPTADGMPTVKVQIEHATTPIKADDLSKPGDKVLGDHQQPGDHKPNKDITYADLHKTITRTISLQMPDGKTKTIKQDAVLTRDATVDDVTGDVNYSAWEHGNSVWASFEVPSIDGYTPSQATVGQATVNDGMTDQTINITYTKNPTPVTPDRPSHGGSTSGDQPSHSGSADHNGTTPQPGKETASQSHGQGQVKTGAQSVAQRGHGQTGQRLPQTGNDHQGSLVALGFLGLASMLGLASRKKRQD